MRRNPLFRALAVTLALALPLGATAASKPTVGYGPEYDVDLSTLTITDDASAISSQLCLVLPVICPTTPGPTAVLTLPAVQVPGVGNFEVKLGVSQTAGVTLFELIEATATDAGEIAATFSTETGLAEIPGVKLGPGNVGFGGHSFTLTLKYLGGEPAMFALTDATIE